MSLAKRAFQRISCGNQKYNLEHRLDTTLVRFCNSAGFSIHSNMAVLHYFTFDSLSRLWQRSQVLAP
jgi:hypothetical protein